MTVKLAIAGSSGRMGRMIIESALRDPQVRVVAALDRADSPQIGEDCAAFLGQPIGVQVVSDLAAIGGADVLIDFTCPEATLAHVAACALSGTGAVIGTTGFTAEQAGQLDAAARRCAMVIAPNMSLGVQALLRLVEQAAGMLGEEYDLEIIEAHHRDKVDAPSGTALQIGQVAAQARGRDLDEVAVFARHGQTGARRRGSIGFCAIRGGDIVGDHSVVFAAAGERIEITHRSSSRVAYALGALRAAKFLPGRAPGRYSMRDVLAA